MKTAEDAKKERELAYQKKYYLKHGDKIRARMREYRRRPEVKEKRKTYRQKNREKFREYSRLWYKKNGRIRVAGYVEAILEWRQDNPEKAAISIQFRRAVHSGKIKRSDSCSKCGKKCRAQAHHYDYKDYRHFIWVCASCHKLIHLGEKH